MERVFYISHIDNVDDINSLSLALTEMEEVSHIKILKDAISFNCAQPESVQEFLEESQYDYVLNEEVNSRKREYDSSEKKEHIYMFANLESEEEARQIQDVLTKYSAYENVEVDFSNKLLRLTTSNKNTFMRIKRIVENINPHIQVEQWKKPFRSQDIFNEKFIPVYLKIALLLVGGAIGLVTRADPNFLTRIGWLVVLCVLNERTWKQAYKDLRVKQFLSENVVIVLAILAGWAFQAYGEAILVSLLYQLGDAISLRVMNWTMNKIDDLLNSQVLARRLNKEQVEMIPLDDFDIGDTMIVKSGETIQLGGTIVKGEAQLDVYALNGSDIYEQSQINKEVYSGTKVIDGELQIKVGSPYEISAMSKVLEIATLAPVSKSHTHLIIDKVSVFYTRILVILGIVCCTIIPLINFENNAKYIYLGAIMLTMAGSFAYKQGASFAVLAGIGKAFSKKIVIKENRGLDDLNLCRTIIYDRFDGIEVTEEEMELFAKIKKMYKDLIIFNDGPVDLENDEYNIYNNLSVEEKLEVMENASVAGPVAYIGDCDKDIVLLQKAFVGISRGGVHNKKVINNSDIMLTSSSLDTIIDLIKIAKKQKYISVENIMIGIFVSVAVVLAGLSFVMPWTLASVIYIVETVLVLLNTHRIIEM